MLYGSINSEIIDVKKGLKNCSDSETKYLNKLREYVSKKDNFIEKAKEHLAINDLSNYESVSRELKSSSFAIGCEKLGLLFGELENHAKYGNIDYCTINNKYVLGLYDFTCREIAKLLQNNDNTNLN